MSPRALMLGLVALSLAAACGVVAGPAKPTAPARVVVLPPATSADAPSSLPPNQDPCRGRAPCAIDQRHPAGRSAVGHAMAVVELSLGERSDDEGFGRSCERREAWLVHAGAGAPPPRLLLESCNDGYGASGVGEDVLEVSDNIFVHTRSGGSSWRWREATRVRLDPPAILEETWGSWWAVSDAHDAEIRDDYIAFRVDASLEVPRCDAQGGLPDTPDLDVIQSRWQAVPSLALPTRLVADAARDIAGIDLSACALRLEHSSSNADRRLAAVIDTPSKTLFVQVEDDAFGPGDELRVWTAAEAVDAGAHCAEPHPSARFAFDIDGRIVSTTSSPAPTRVELASSPDGRRRLYRITLTVLPAAMTVGYQDVDPKEPPVTIASSDVDSHRGDSAGLGRVRPMSDERVRCELDGERLVPVLAEPPPRTQAIVGG
jgi:hypothetical protein